MRTSRHIEGAMRRHGLVMTLFLALMAFGIWSLPRMNKDEFPQFTMRQALLVAVYPGATAGEVEQQVTIPLEDYINSFEAVDKSLTYSQSQDGIAYVYIMLRMSDIDNEVAWNKIRAGLPVLQKTQMPAGVLQTVLIDDFGNTSSLLIAVESAERSPRELEQYAKQVCSTLRTIPEMGKLRIMGQQTEEIAITIDMEQLSRYGINPSALQAQMAMQGLRTIGGESDVNGSLQVVIPYMSEYELQQQIVWSDPVTGATVRLKDIAAIERRYQTPKQYVEFDGASCLILNMEMVPGNNIVAFGKEVDKHLAEAAALLPPDIHFHRITDQPKVVDDSVLSFLRDILISILVVIAVMLMLFPLRTALVAATGLPVCTAICVGLMYLTGIELNTVTLAALIFVLGMIVDDSVIVIDGYTNQLEKRHSRWYSAVVSTSMLFVPMSLATMAICGMFFPMTRIITGPLGEFVQLFPWAVLFALVASIFYASWVTPFLAFRYVRERRPEELNLVERIQNRFFAWLQNAYKKALQTCFKHPVIVWLLLGGTTIIGLLLLANLNLQLLPKAEREFFAVEIHLRDGAPLQETAVVADSLASILRADPRVTCVTAFIGQSSPRFHATYTPQTPATNYAQLIVNTKSGKATSQVLKQYTNKYENYFPNAYARFKQLDYQAVKNPLEVRVQGEDWEQMAPYADSIFHFMVQQPELQWVHCDYNNIAASTRIVLKADEATRLGITETMLSVYLRQATQGAMVTTLYEGSYAVPVMLYTAGVNTLNADELGAIQVPTAIPSVWVPLRQVATIEPDWHHTNLERRNAIRTMTVGADLRGTTSQVSAERKVKNWIKTHITELPEGVSLKYGGLTEVNGLILPQILWSIVAALAVMLVLLLYHFGKIGLAMLTLSSAVLCVFGAMLGLTIFDLDISITAVLGIVSLIGIIVRNAIMMYEYAEDARKYKQLTYREAAFQAGLRRMRPVFLTSATTALGVLPMILAHTSLWMPMGVVICFGTIFTLPLTVTILPVVYWKIYARKDANRDI
ncbi:MAG: efflux RND transporter permease subunit [Paludibacteraceae bacterium]|nr:efflux RND transporter permease subunit [Paludibacteraceae bacterium]